MAYCLLQTDKCLQSALRRSGKAEIAAALAHLGAATPLSDDAIHDIRKSVKKLRALLQLVSPGFAHGRAEDGALRDMGRALAGTRDAAVRLATFDRVMAGDTAPDLAPLRAILLAQDTPAPSQDLAALAADFRALRERAARWKLHGKDHDILTKGLMKARLRACKAMHRAKAHPDQDRLHRWRRTVKTHWYHARLLAPVWAAALTPLAEAADILGESLGNHNDISMLISHLTNLPPETVPSGALTQLVAGGIAAQRAIEADAFALGARLFTGDAKVMANLWADWWAIWRAEGQCAPAKAPESPASISAIVSCTP